MHARPVEEPAARAARNDRGWPGQARHQRRGQGVRSCLTQEQVQTNDIPLQDPQSGCTQKITERNGNVWKFTFSCPKAQGNGEAQFLSDREFLTKVSGTFNASGVEQKGSMNTRAVWLGNDCGTVKPRT
ncbi:DUF3617 domain-containing protein [Pseudomonas qingdaonensis]|nr:DUF3617 domain-containing protein [Pseudomonas qingdaonensis]